jgi:hypothetical protein
VLCLKIEAGFAEDADRIGVLTPGRDISAIHVCRRDEEWPFAAVEHKGRAAIDDERAASLRPDPANGYDIARSRLHKRLRQPSPEQPDCFIARRLFRHDRSVSTATAKGAARQRTTRVHQLIGML